MRILSGLYGLLRPLDGIQPYRLEMGSRLKNARGANLHAYWGPVIAGELDKAVKAHDDPTIVLWTIESNEPENDLGDGNTEPDIFDADLVTEDYEFQLRAERRGLEDGRVYTVTYETMDASGNKAQDVATVTVPHDQN